MILWWEVEQSWCFSTRPRPPKATRGQWHGWHRMGYDSHSRERWQNWELRKLDLRTESVPAAGCLMPLLLSHCWQHSPHGPRTFSGLTPPTLTLHGSRIPQLFPEKLSEVWTHKLTWTGTSCQEPLSACRGNETFLNSACAPFLTLPIPTYQNPMPSKSSQILSSPRNVLMSQNISPALQNYLCIYLPSAVPWLWVPPRRDQFFFATGPSICFVESVGLLWTK